MKTLLKNGTIVNVFTENLEKADILLEDEKIVGVGAYGDEAADIVEDISGKFVCPGFIDSHIHIESTLLLPAEFARTVLPHGTTAVVADPHEIANVCGTEGIRFMLEASAGLPLTVYIMLPSCVPATPLDENGAVLTAEDLEPFYAEPRVLGLAEVMDYPGVIAKKKDIIAKIVAARKKGKAVDGHAPLLSGRGLDSYIAAGIESDHECSNFAEAAEKLSKGQWIMIREGTAARNLDALLELFEEPWCRSCLLATDDRHPEDLLQDGHIDHIIRRAVAQGKDAVRAITMATLHAARRFNLRSVGAVAPGYRADLLVLDELKKVAVRDVYCGGKKTVSKGQMLPFADPVVNKELLQKIKNTFHLDRLTPADFHIEAKSEKCRVIKTLPGELLTEEEIVSIDWAHANGVDTKRDIVKLAVIERHRHTGHRGLGFVSGLGLKRGALATSVAHDSHNLAVAGTNDEDMAVAAERARELGGGYVLACEGKIIAELPLPIAGLMSELDAEEAAAKNKELLDKLQELGVPRKAAPLMTLAFLSLPVIPHLKLTTRGLADVAEQKIVPLYV